MNEALLTRSRFKKNPIETTFPVCYNGLNLKTL